MASRYKEAERLTSKESGEVAKSFVAIYKRSPLVWPEMLRVDPGREFFGAVTNLMEKHNTFIRRGRKEIHQDQGIVERFKRTLAERLFGHQYAVEILKNSFDNAGIPTQRSTAWVERLPEVVAAINNEVTSLTGLKPVDAVHRYHIHALLASAKKNCRLAAMAFEFAICTSPASLKVGANGEQRIRFGL